MIKQNKGGRTGGGRGHDFGYDRNPVDYLRVKNELSSNSMDDSVWWTDKKLSYVFTEVPDLVTKSRDRHSILVPPHSPTRSP